MPARSLGAPRRQGPVETRRSYPPEAACRQEASQQGGRGIEAADALAEPSLPRAQGRRHREGVTARLHTPSHSTHATSACVRRDLLLEQRAVAKVLRLRKRTHAPKDAARAQAVALRLTQQRLLLLPRKPWNAEECRTTCSTTPYSACFASRLSVTTETRALRQ